MCARKLESVYLEENVEFGSKWSVTGETVHLEKLESYCTRLHRARWWSFYCIILLCPVAVFEQDLGLHNYMCVYFAYMACLSGCGFLFDRFMAMKAWKLSAACIYRSPVLPSPFPSISLESVHAMKEKDFLPCT